MEFGSEVAYVTKDDECEEVEELEYYKPSSSFAANSSAPRKSTSYKPKRSANYKDDGEVCG